MKTTSLKKIEAILKLMQTYQVSSLEMDGMRILKTRFPEPSISPTIPTQSTSKQKAPPRKTVDVARDLELDRRAREDKKLFYPDV